MANRRQIHQRSNRSPHFQSDWQRYGQLAALSATSVLFLLVGCRSSQKRCEDEPPGHSASFTPTAGVTAAASGASNSLPETIDESSTNDIAAASCPSENPFRLVGTAAPLRTAAATDDPVQSSADSTKGQDSIAGPVVSPTVLPSGSSDTNSAVSTDDAGSLVPSLPTEQLQTPSPQNTLFIDEVLVSATESFPSIREAAMLRNQAIGNQIAALGEFDDKLEAFTINQPLGFYENYRHGLGWKKPLLLGGTSYAGYRIGDGDFEPWFGDRETNEGGEFKAGFDIPLFQNRAIDPRRTALRLASLDVQRANPELYQQVLLTQLEAATAYWSWVAAAKQHDIARDLMTLAEVRVEQIDVQIRAGDVASIVAIDNRRLLATRKTKLIEARQKLDSAAIKLSLYYRDSRGRPRLPSNGAHPEKFPSLPTGNIDVEAEIQRAINNRPELEILGLIEEQTRAELRLAINQRMPEISFGTEVSQDVGGLASSKGDKQPFKLEAGVIGSVPVQRRKAIGKAQSLRAKLAQIDAKRQLTADKISNDVRQAVTIFEAAKLRYEQAMLTEELANQTLTAGEIAFAAGDIDILLLNIYEQAVADARAEVIRAEADVLTAEAMLIASSGRTLLDDVPMIPVVADEELTPP